MSQDLYSTSLAQYITRFRPQADFQKFKEKLLQIEEKLLDDYIEMAAFEEPFGIFDTDVLKTVFDRICFIPHDHCEDAFKQYLHDFKSLATG